MKNVYTRRQNRRNLRNSLIYLYPGQGVNRKGEKLNLIEYIIEVFTRYIYYCYQYLHFYYIHIYL